MITYNKFIIFNELNIYFKNNSVLISYVENDRYNPHKQKLLESQ